VPSSYFFGSEDTGHVQALQSLAFYPLNHPLQEYDRQARNSSAKA